MPSKPNCPFHLTSNREASHYSKTQETHPLATLKKNTAGSVHKGPTWLLNAVHRSYLFPRSSRSPKSAEQEEDCIEILSFRNCEQLKGILCCSEDRNSIMRLASILIGRTLPWLICIGYY